MAYQAGGPDHYVLRPRASNPNISRQAGFGFSRRPVSPEQVLKSFNTRAFKRETPGNPDLMLKVIAEALVRREPVPFFMYWGKGLRPLLGGPEQVCLDYLASMLSRVREVYEPGASLSLAFTDTHATLNGHSQDSIGSYFEDLTRAARKRGFAVSLLSQLIEESGLSLDSAPASDPPPAELLADLRTSATKWFRGEGTPEQGAVCYYRANMIEKQVIERAFPRSIFVTFNGSKLKPLFPDSMPIFYMFSLRHGVSDKPWFLPPDTVIGRTSTDVAPIEVVRTA